MTHINRSRLTIKSDGMWWLYSDGIDVAEMLGVVYNGGGLSLGACVKFNDGTYALVNGDVVKRLNSKKVLAALEK